MVKTITIDVFNDSVIKLLEDLELLNFLKMKQQVFTNDAKIDFTQFIGKLSPQTESDIQTECKKLRDEWDLSEKI